MTSPLFDVLLEKSDAPASSIAEAIAAHKKIPFQDAAHEARLAWGFVGLDLSKSDADALSATMTSKGISTVVLPHDEVAPLLPVEDVTSLGLKEAGLALTLASDQIETIPFASIAVLAACGIPVRSVTTEKKVEGPSKAKKALQMGLLMAGLPIPLGGRKKEVVTTRVTDDILFFLDMVLTPVPRRFRVDAQSLSYAFLQERMVHNTLLNFKTLLAELVRLSPRARINKGVRTLTKNLVVTQMGYETISDLEKETRWLTALSSRT